jgi:hypothetical protein
MDNLTFRRFEMLRRVKQFGAAHLADFPETSVGKALFEQLDLLVAELETLGVNQLSGFGDARSGVTAKTIARKALINALIAIQRTSRSLAYDLPGLAGKFASPRGLSDQALLTTARAYVQAVTPHQERFVKHELAADFLDQLRLNIAAFEQAVTQKQAAVSLHRSAKIGLDGKMLDGVQTVRQLDALIRNKYRDNSVVLAEWQHAARVSRRGRPVEPEEAEGETSAASPA